MEVQNVTLAIHSVYWVHKDGSIFISPRCCLMLKFSCEVNDECSSRLCVWCKFWYQRCAFNIFVPTVLNSGKYTKWRNKEPPTYLKLQSIILIYFKDSAMITFASVVMTTLLAYFFQPKSLHIFDFKFFCHVAFFIVAYIIA